MSLFVANLYIGRVDGRKSTLQHLQDILLAEVLAHGLFGVGDTLCVESRKDWWEDILFLGVSRNRGNIYA